MDLKKAFGGSYKPQVPQVPSVPSVPSVPPTKMEKIDNVQSIQKFVQSSGKTLGAPRRVHNSKSKLGSPMSDIYMIQIQIGRDDCHLLCMFLLVFIISILLNKK